MGWRKLPTIPCSCLAGFSTKDALTVGGTVFIDGGVVSLFRSFTTPSLACFVTDKRRCREKHVEKSKVNGLNM